MKIHLEDRAFRRVGQGYPWIFRSEVLNAKDAAKLEAGTVVDFTGKKGDFAARGFYNPLPQLVGRTLTQDEGEKIDAAFFHKRIAAALKYRDALYGAPFYRLIHAESDGFPGLIADRYGDVIVAQVNTAGMEKQFAHIQAALMELVKPRAIILRNDTSAREQEGLARETKVVYGALDGPVKILENGVPFMVDVLEGQKTGWFFDQRDNRAWVASLAQGKSVIDIFCHTGGFGVTALGKGAASATFVDSSDKALEAALKNSGGEGKGIVGRAFDVMENLGKTYGVVCVDPPAFIKTRKDMGAGMQGYKKLAKLAAPMVEKGGFLFFASCSHHASAQELLENVSESLARAGRPFQLVRSGFAGADHPVHPLLPETGYLKAFTFRFLD
jgi:23S rRNA (cytosine1962-C5)-methyltransferase